MHAVLLQTTGQLINCKALGDAIKVQADDRMFTHGTPRQINFQSLARTWLAPRQTFGWRVRAKAASSHQRTHANIKRVV